MPSRDFKFYAELVLVTVLSLVAANAWVRVLNQALNRYYPGSIKVDIFSAIIVTLVAIAILHFGFSRKESPYQEDPDIMHHSAGRLYLSQEE